MAYVVMLRARLGRSIPAWARLEVALKRGHSPNRFTSPLSKWDLHKTRAPALLRTAPLPRKADGIQIAIADFLQQQTAALLRTLYPAGWTEIAVFPPIAATL
ncbi:hypothetical protein B0H13DRAFT_1872767 [Mycena leptocephala]|nr:hypothetical protein B0H13DRAFT_1872767 [Mycena leptocephala]